MNPALCLVLRTVQTHDQRQPAITEPDTATVSTYGELAALAGRFRRTLAQLGVEPGDTIGSDLSAGRDLAALLLACLAEGLRLDIVQTAEGPRPLDRTIDAITLFVCRERSLMPSGRVRTVSVAELGESAAAWSLFEPTDRAAEGRVSITTEGGTSLLDAAALGRSVTNFSAIYRTTPGQRFVSLSSPLTIEALCLSMVIPLALGMHAVLASERTIAAALADASWLAVPADDLLTLIERDAIPAVSAHVRAVFCNGSRPAPAERIRVAAALGRQPHHGYGTAETGLWAVSTPIEPGVNDAGQPYTVGIRELRSPLRLTGAEPGCPTGEVVLHPRAEHQPEHFTGDVGWVTPAGELVVAGRLSEVSVRNGQATLLADLDRLMASHPDIRASRSFREHGKVPTEPVISVCATEVSEASIREWLGERAEPGLAPNRIVVLPAERCAVLPPLDVLRSVVTGTAGQAVVAALTARRFRRNPAYDEAGLAAAAEAALLEGRPLDFLMFWGCGPRRSAAAPDRAAVAALGDLLAAAEMAAPGRARAHVICTDLHATNNGHSESHFLTYFSSIRSLATGLNVDFELESAVWRRGGLSRAAVTALEQEPGFQQQWRDFALRDRFIHQASRHSGMADKTAAARHYYATCLLEREVLKSMFRHSVFLTYNGPDFNECFPDLPTLYVYPGPRGRNDKPWFVDVDDPAADQAQVAAE